MPAVLTCHFDCFPRTSATSNASRRAACGGRTAGGLQWPADKHGCTGKHMRIYGVPHIQKKYALRIFWPVLLMKIRCPVGADCRRQYQSTTIRCKLEKKALIYAYNMLRVRYYYGNYEIRVLLMILAYDSVVGYRRQSRSMLRPSMRHSRPAPFGVASTPSGLLAKESHAVCFKRLQA